VARAHRGVGAQPRRSGVHRSARRSPLRWLRLKSEVDRSREALCRAFGTELGLAEFVSSQRAARWRVLEINEAGTLTPILAKMPGHELAKFPDVHLQALPFAENSYDIVVHSETLEHVPDPVRALKECYRVLAPGGAVCFTIPIIGARLTRSRRGMPNSYHGNSAETSDDLLVRTEYGADAWISVMQAGFAQLSISAVELPASIAFSGWKPVRSPNAGNHRKPYTGGPMGRLVLRAVGHPIRSRIGTRGLVWRLRAKVRT
jgi:SAM-dependent methyltransferase